MYVRISTLRPSLPSLPRSFLPYFLRSFVVVVDGWMAGCLCIMDGSGVRAHCRCAIGGERVPYERLSSLLEVRVGFCAVLCPRIVFSEACREMSKHTGPDLKKYMEKSVCLKMNGQRTVKGTMRGYDQFMNVVLDEAVDGGTAEKLGQVVVRGNSIVQIEILPWTE